MADSNDIVLEPASEVHRDFRVQKRLCLVGLAVLSAVWGGVDVFMAEGTTGEKAVTIVGALLALSLGFAWLYYDSIEQHYPIGMLLGVCIILLAGIGIPIYLFKTRGLRGFVSLGLVLLFGIGLGLISYASSWADAIVLAVAAVIVGGMIGFMVYSLLLQRKAMVRQAKALQTVDQSLVYQKESIELQKQSVTLLKEISQALKEK